MNNICLIKHKIYNKWYVIPFNEKDKKFDSKLKTATKWAGSTTNVSDHVNDFCAGYAIVSCRTRESTSANHVVIKHPLGFEFEIQANEFIKLCINITIVKGIIQDKCKIVPLANNKLSLDIEGISSSVMLTDVSDGVYAYTTKMDKSTTDYYIPNVSVIYQYSDGRHIDTKTKNLRFVSYRWRSDNIKICIGKPSSYDKASVASIDDITKFNNFKFEDNNHYYSDTAVNVIDGKIVVTVTY